MDHYETSFYTQAITLAKMGHREQAYSAFKRLALNNPQDQDIVLWLVYTAPSLEIAQELLDRAYSLSPDSPALRQADQWLTNEKLHLPQPAAGYSLFPPAGRPAQVLPDYSTQSITPYQAQPSQNSYYPTTQMSPYQPMPSYPVPAYRYPVPYYAGPPSYPQPYNYRPNYAPAPYYPPYQRANPPVYWNNPASYAYNSYLAMGHNYRCPYCNTTYPPVNNRRISRGGWVTFAVLAGLFFPLCWIGLLMQENYLRCSYCHLVLT